MMRGERVGTPQPATLVTLLLPVKGARRSSRVPAGPSGDRSSSTHRWSRRSAPVRACCLAAPLQLLRPDLHVEGPGPADLEGQVLGLAEDLPPSSVSITMGPVCRQAMDEFDGSSSQWPRSRRQKEPSRGPVCARASYNPVPWLLAGRPEPTPRSRPTVGSALSHRAARALRRPVCCRWRRLESA
jgi:hypothetical protein